MRELEYPFNAGTLLRKKNKIRRDLLNSGNKWIDTKIAVLGGSTTNEIVDQLELFLLNNGIRAEFYQSDYNKYYEDAVFGNEVLDSFQPRIVYIHTNWRNIHNFPTISDKDDTIESKISDESQRLQNCWRNLKKRYGCEIIQNNFDKPYYRILGNRDVWDIHGKLNFVNRLNSIIYDFASHNESFYVNDIDYLAYQIGSDKWNDAIAWYMYKYICSIDSIPYLSFSVANIIKSLYGMNKKAIVTDLDNTLWGGVIGDDGLSGIKIGAETAEGEAYLTFQKYLRELKKNGIILNVNSKNNYESAIDGLNHPEGELKEKDFTIIKANWNRKDENITSIANELSIGVNAIVFLDDNEAERDLVRENIEGCSVPVMERPENYIRNIDRGGFFETTIVTDDDRNKVALYENRNKILGEKEKFTDYGEFLDSLHMRAEIEDFNETYLQRIAQLTNKTNQFNLTTKRFSESEIRNMWRDGKHICLYGKLYDKYGDNGLVTVFIGEINGGSLDIILWLMSCRVLKRGLEDALINAVVEKANITGLDSITGIYYPTSKNSMVKDLYEGFGFTKINEEEDGTTEWHLKIKDYVKRQTHINCMMKNE